MNNIRELSQRRGVIPVVAALLGLIAGVVYAWVIDPVEWTDATPALLRADFRRDYLGAAIDSYQINRDVDLAVSRYQALGEVGPQVLAELQADPGEVNPAAIDDFAATVALYQATPGAGPREPTAAPAPSAATFLLPVCGVTLILGLLLVAVVALRGRGGRRRGRVPTESFEEGEAEAGPYEAARPSPARPTGLDRPPLATFRTTYTLGDDLYDDSFSIESAAGDFLGECGVGIGDLIGVGDPKKVSAFEVWLFDKNDIQTVTKVLMSRYAYQDEATRSRMAAKGDPILAEPGAVVVLETASLMVEARIVDLTYGGGALPAESFFERLTVELRAASKLGVD